MTKLTSYCRVHKDIRLIIGVSRYRFLQTGPREWKIFEVDTDDSYNRWNDVVWKYDEKITSAKLQSCGLDTKGLVIV